MLTERQREAVREAAIRIESSGDVADLELAVTLRSIVGTHDIDSTATASTRDGAPHDAKDRWACHAVQLAAQPASVRAMVENARETAIREAASVDARVIATLMTLGKVSRDDVFAALDVVAGKPSGSASFASERDNDAAVRDRDNAKGVLH